MQHVKTLLSACRTIRPVHGVLKGSLLVHQIRMDLRHAMRTGLQHASRNCAHTTKPGRLRRISIAFPVSLCGNRLMGGRLAYPARYRPFSTGKEGFGTLPSTPLHATTVYAAIRPGLFLCSGPRTHMPPLSLQDEGYMAIAASARIDGPRPLSIDHLAMFRFINTAPHHVRHIKLLISARSQVLT